MGTKHALLIGNTEYNDAGLSHLRAPEADIHALADLLTDPQVGEFDSITTLLNKPYNTVSIAIADLFADKKPFDLLFFYFSGHGVLDEQGRLYLLLNDSRRNRLSVTAIQALFLKDEMDRCRSKQVVLVLDCCHSGAFAQGIKGAVGTQALTDFTFHGQGRYILTATDKTQFAWEGDQLIGEAKNSLFTHFLIEGIKTGSADLNGSGQITLDELYDYVYQQVIAVTPNQKPRKIVYDQQGDFPIFKNPHKRDIRPVDLPSNLQQDITNPSYSVRDSAVRALESLLTSDEAGLALSAHLALKALAEDLDPRIAYTASEILSTYETSKMYGPEAEIERIWRMWLLSELRRETDGSTLDVGSAPNLESRGLATPQQVRLLADTSAGLRPKENRALLLLRSAVYHDQPPETFLDWLRSGDAYNSEVNAIEMSQPGGEPGSSLNPSLRLAQTLLGTINLSLPYPGSSRPVGFGPVAWCSAAHHNMTSWLTAALALATVSPDNGIRRIEAALDAGYSQPGRKLLAFWRRAELYGGLLDASFPRTLLAKNSHSAQHLVLEGAPASQELAPAARPNYGGSGFWTWFWRFKRRFFRHSRRITAAVLGGGTAAGLALAVWRFLLALMSGWANAGAVLPVFFFLGFLFGGSISFALTVTEPILLENSRSPENSPPDWRFGIGPAWLPGVLAVGLSTLVFGLVHAFMVIVIALPSQPTWHMIPLGFLAALGISLGLYGQPRTGLRIGWKHWSGRLAAPALVLATLQAFPCLFGQDWQSTNFTQSSAAMWALFKQFDVNGLWIRGEYCQGGFAFETMLSALFAAFVGILLVLSIAAGMHFMIRQFHYRDDKQHR
jgi:uncharacterized caspase-like protein